MILSNFIGLFEYHEFLVKTRNLSQFIGWEAVRPGSWEAQRLGSQKARRLESWEARKQISWEAWKPGSWEAQLVLTFS
jgi:hypothetical protein